MKNILYTTLLLCFCAILLSSTTLAFSTNNLRAYYAFEETNTSIMHDSLGLNNLTKVGASAPDSITGIVGKAFNMSNGSVNAKPSYTGHIFNMTAPTSYSINFWMKNPGATNTQTLFSISNGTTHSTRYLKPRTSPAGLVWYNGTNVNNNVLVCTSPTVNTWTMYTIVHDQGTNTVYCYKNGELDTSSTDTDLGRYTDTFTLGEVGVSAMAFIGYDELSLWNESLSVFDIIDLYNNGVGRNYSQTNQSSQEATTTTNDTSVCMTNHESCTHPYFINGYYYCNIEDIEYCSLGCLNMVADNTTGEILVTGMGSCNEIYGTLTTKDWNCDFTANTRFHEWYNLFLQLPYVCINTTKTMTIAKTDCNDTILDDWLYPTRSTDDIITFGQCAQATNCVNECNILGATSCDSTTSFIRCGNYDTDTCLELSTPFGCMSGEVCSVTGCTANTALGDLNVNLHSWDIIPRHDSTTGTTYTNDVNKRILHVNTADGFHIQELSVSATNMSTTYVTQPTCDYKETVVNTNTVQANTTNGTSTSIVFTPITGASIVTLNITMNNTVNSSAPSTVSIKTVSALSEPINGIAFVRTPSTKELCMYESNTTTDTANLIFCDYSNNNYDDLRGLSIAQYYDGASKSFTYNVLVDRLTPRTYSTRIIIYTTTTASTVETYTLNTTSDNSESFITSSTHVTVPQYSGLSTTVYNTPSKYSCTYTTTGCRRIAMWLSDTASPAFNNKREYTVCLDSVTSANANADDSIDTSGLAPVSPGTRLFIVLVIVFITIIGFTIAGNSMGDMKMGMGVGSALAFFILILASIPGVPLIGGFVPAWIVIVLLLFIVLFTTYMIIRPTTGGSSDG